MSGRNPHVCGNVHGEVEIPQSTRTRTRTRTRASSGGEGRHGERRGGAKRDARGLKTRKRPRMMVIMARVAFRVLKTKNGAAIAVRDGGHDIGRTDPTSWASARASTASGSHRRRTWPSTHPWGPRPPSSERRSRAANNVPIWSAQSVPSCHQKEFIITCSSNPLPFSATTSV